MKILDGKTVAAAMKQKIAERTVLLKKNTGTTPHLAAILVGNDGASETYVANKIKSCAEVGFESTLLRFPADTSAKEVTDAIRKLNDDPGIHGILVQLPLPKHINESEIINLIDPAKDVDGFHPMSVGSFGPSLGWARSSR